MLLDEQNKQMGARKRYASPVISFYALELDFWVGTFVVHITMWLSVGVLIIETFQSTSDGTL